jgi:hypothetical protein
MAERYPKEVCSFIHSNYKGKRPDELAALVNQKFGTEYSSLQMRYFMRNHKLRSGLPTGRKQPYTDIFPKEVVEYIKANYKGVGPSEMAERLNKQFGKNYTRSQLKSYYGNHDINSGLTGRFEKGHVPVNPFKPGECPPNSKATQFKKGNIPINHREVGSERVNVDGYIEIKISEPNVWRMKHNVVWEEHNGKIPEGHKIIFLDRNPLNCDISNLEIVSNAVLLEMNRRKLHSPDPDYEQTGILIAKVNCAAYKREKGNKNE